MLDAPDPSLRMCGPGARQLACHPRLRSYRFVTPSHRRRAWMNLGSPRLISRVLRLRLWLALPVSVSVLVHACRLLSQKGYFWLLWSFSWCRRKSGYLESVIILRTQWRICRVFEAANWEQSLSMACSYIHIVCFETGIKRTMALPISSTTFS